MNKEQIIIDGVDVAECIYYADSKCTNSQMIQSNCKNVAVCYFKEYKRKEQECEELRDELEWVHGIKDKLNKEIEELNKELLQKRITILKNNDHYHMVDQTNIKLKQALQEIEKLAIQGNIYCIDYNVDDCEKCIKQNDCKTTLFKQILQKCEVLDE